MYLFLDTETHAAHDPVMIQLAYRASDQESYFSNYYSTGGPTIDFGAMAVHHITEEMIADHPRFDDTPDKMDLQVLLGDHVLVAHNAPFDTGVLSNHDVQTPRSICTLKIARHVYPEMESHKLQYLRYALGTKFETEIQAHDALDDVRVLEGVFWIMHAELKQLENLTDENDIIARMEEISRLPSLLHMCRFGKHKWTPWSEVPSDYLEWILNKSTFADEDVLYTVRYWLENSRSN